MDEDMNRVWDERVLHGSRQSEEIARARMLRPLLDEVDVLLDLHSMLWPSDPLIITGSAPQARALGPKLGTPSLAVADQGHSTGRRMIDSAAFTAPAAAAPPCWWKAARIGSRRRWKPWKPAPPPCCANTGCCPRPRPHPHRPAGGGDAHGGGRHAWLRLRAGLPRRHHHPRRNTLLALDGEQEIRTPHDDCLLVMPSPRTLRGHTAVRLARFV
ncbi:hypothetical protein ACFQU7_11315 [Pseudoroseomonas wenyumeiae]